MKLANIIEGMHIVAKHTQDQYCVAAEHDELFCGAADLPLTEEEQKRMRELGWVQRYDSWCAFT